MYIRYDLLSIRPPKLHVGFQNANSDNQICPTISKDFDLCRPSQYGRIYLDQLLSFCRQVFLLKRFHFKNCCSLKKIKFGLDPTSSRTLINVFLILDRRYGYYLVNAFLQTLALTFLGYSCFFIDIEDFTDRLKTWIYSNGIGKRGLL